jgi:hypothetical protein
MPVATLVAFLLGAASAVAATPSPPPSAGTEDSPSPAAKVPIQPRAARPAKTLTYAGTLVAAVGGASLIVTVPFDLVCFLSYFETDIRVCRPFEIAVWAGFGATGVGSVAAGVGALADWGAVGEGRPSAVPAVAGLGLAVGGVAFFASPFYAKMDAGLTFPVGEVMMASGTILALVQVAHDDRVLNAQGIAVHPFPNGIAVTARF